MSTFGSLKASVYEGILASYGLQEGPVMDGPVLEKWFSENGDEALGQLLTKITIDGPDETFNWELYLTKEGEYVIVERWTHDEPDAWILSPAGTVA